MHKSKLVLVQDDEAAQKLIVTWPLVWRLEGEARLERWEAVSGVDRLDIETRQELLFANDFLGPEGLVPTEVEESIAMFVDLKLMGPKKARRA
jgi:hypothetical protein